MGRYRIGLAEWYEEHPDAPTRGEAAEDMLMYRPKPQDEMTDEEYARVPVRLRRREGPQNNPDLLPF